METIVEKLKVGSPLVMGEYSVQKAFTPEQIVWLKGTPNSDFITESVVDFLPLDALERENPEMLYRYSGNADYLKSNLMQFLNSDQENWYSPTHQYDAPPSRSNVNDRYRAPYDKHYGFMFYFEDYEVESIQDNDGIKIWLPTYEDFNGENKFQLFKRKGTRARGTMDFVYNKGLDFSESSYVPFWLSNKNDTAGKAYIMGRNGDLVPQRPVNACGVRPVCNIRPETVVVKDDDGFYHIKPRACKNAFTDEELFEFLGMAQP